MTRVSISINESDYNILQLHNCNISDICRRELQKISKNGLQNCIDINEYEPLTRKEKHRMSVNLISDNPSDYYEEDYKLPFIIRCIINQYVDNLRRHE